MKNNKNTRNYYDMSTGNLLTATVKKTRKGCAVTSEMTIGDYDFVVRIMPNMQITASVNHDPIDMCDVPGYLASAIDYIVGYSMWAMCN